jgi:hypothetical protein
MKKIPSAKNLLSVIIKNNFSTEVKLLHRKRQSIIKVSQLIKAEIKIRHNYSISKKKRNNYRTKKEGN